MAEANILARVDDKGGGNLIGDLGVGLNANAGVLDNNFSDTVLKDATIGDNNTVNVDKRKVKHINVESGGTYIETETTEEKWDAAKKIAGDVKSGIEKTIYNATPIGFIENTMDNVKTGVEKTAAQLKAKFSGLDNSENVVDANKSADELSL